MGGSSTTTVREMTAEDAERVAALSGQLGYPSTPDQIRHRLLGIEAHPEARVFVACDAVGRVQGWVHVYGHRQLESGGAAEVGGLVVDEEARGQGMGRALMAAAESWARERGYERLTLRSNVVRDEAHRFYQRLGYTIVKSQHKFQKPIV
ncbi:MAG TPA: GNAT family N-acetyltransferase [Candidatus Polarisedimenticolia bacterium]|nr:GNAT family N-acetyltransferase [Candidatus Polarisedimenticolia bacterium]